jgi:hypothetical protein
MAAVRSAKPAAFELTPGQFTAASLVQHSGYFCD